MQVVEMIRKDILPFSSELPKNFIASVLQILNRGSIHSQSPSKLFAISLVPAAQHQFCYSSSILLSMLRTVSLYEAKC